MSVRNVRRLVPSARVVSRPSKKACVGLTYNFLVSHLELLMRTAAPRLFSPLVFLGIPQ